MMIRLIKIEMTLVILELEISSIVNCSSSLILFFNQLWTSCQNFQLTEQRKNKCSVRSGFSWQKSQCKSHRSTSDFYFTGFHIGAVSVNVHIQVRIFIVQVLKFTSTCSRVLLLFYLHKKTDKCLKIQHLANVLTSCTPSLVVIGKHMRCNLMYFS